MCSKSSKNCIIKGPVTSFCLVCECLVRNVDEVDKHIEDPDHGSRVGLYPYLEKYGRDCIRKIKGLYLCECCSVVLKTATKVNAHICTREHINNRGSQQLRVGPDNGVIAFDEVLITEDAWHAIDHHCCSLCDEEGDSQHKHSTSHLVKLVQSKIEFVENGLYRKIDENTVQCLTCNVMFDINSINNHFDSKGHKVAFTKSKIQEDEINDEIKTEKAYAKNTESPKLKDTAHTDKAKDDEKATAPETKDSKKKTQDNIAATSSDRIYCGVCEVTMPATQRYTHVADIKQVNKLKSNKPKLVTKLFKQFVKDRNMFADATNFSCYFIINSKICIPLNNFWVIGKISGGLRCHICEESFKEDLLLKHVIKPPHVEAMDNALVVISLDNEFLREIHPSIFHCGYCNVLVTKWDDVPNHLARTDHNLQKAACQDKLNKLRKSDEGTSETD